MTRPISSRSGLIQYEFSLTMSREARTSDAGRGEAPRGPELAPWPG
jgi:hypothetical protein